MYAHYSFSCCK